MSREAARVWALRDGLVGDIYRGTAAQKRERWEAEMLRKLEEGAATMDLRMEEGQDLRRQLALSIIRSLDQVPTPVLEALALVAKKNQDYNSNTDRSLYFPFGLKSYVHMIWTKALRVVNLVKSDSEPNFEGVRDSLLDMINYASFTVEAMDKGQLK